MRKGRIIFLNGVSSSGKSTLAKALQDKLPEPFYLIANDIFTEMMSPEKFLEDETEAIETYERILTGMYHTIKTFSDIGINVIVDEVLLKGDFNPLGQCVGLLHGHNVLFVQVICSDLDELGRRERIRGDRDMGEAEFQLDELDPQRNSDYDITVDTFKNTIEECAEKIIAKLNSGEKFKAFEILWEEKNA